MPVNHDILRVLAANLRRGPYRTSGRKERYGDGSSKPGSRLENEAAVRSWSLSVSEDFLRSMA